MSVQQPRQAEGGKLVALEGDIDTISTQLRLLPPSQKILILPSLIEGIAKPTDTNKHSFDPRTFICNVHAAFTHRNETARSFLESSTSNHPRLVFMNGGSVSARAACISNICENVTNGDSGEAESIFDEIVKEGVVGLWKDGEVAIEDGQWKSEDESLAERVEKVEESEDPTVKAMKAADSLDRETAALQEDAVEGSDGAILQRGDSNEGQRDDTSEDHATVTENTSGLLTSDNEDNIRTTKVTIPERTDGEECDADLTTPSEDMFSVPSTPRVEYGEACVVDVQDVLARKQFNEIRRVRSTESFRSSYFKGQDAILTPRKLNHSKSEYQLGEKRNKAGGRIRGPPSPDLIQLPRSTFVKASTTTTINSPALNLAASSSSSSTSTPRASVGCGEIESKETTSYKPVFPLVEDLVIQLVDNAPNEIIESVIRSYTAPSPAPVSASPRSKSRSSTRSRTPTTNVDEDFARPASYQTAETEFDPYSSNEDRPPSVQLWIPRSKFACNDNATRTPESSAPSITAPLPRNETEEKFCKLYPLDHSSTIGIQDSLRALLNSHFPAGDNGYTQHYFVTTPEADRLWKPVFGNDQNATIGNEERTVDHIVALGCEDGVKKEFFSQISGQVEQLGNKRNGVHRCGKLDLRYLISKAMHEFSTLPLVTQSTTNPLDNPALLATILVPQIEAYLATNTSIHLLVLIYPPDYLSTVVALRKLLGLDVLKIAGVLDTLSSDPPTLGSRPRTPTVTHPLSNEATSPKGARSSRQKGSVSSKSFGSQISDQSPNQPKKTEYSFSKANYLLPSTATDDEIATFLSGIRMSLVEKSAFYTPEPEPEPIIVEKIVERIVEKFIEKPSPPPKHGNSGHGLAPHVQGRESKISRLTGNSSAEKRSQKYAPSIASSVRSASTIRTAATMRTAATVRTTATERGRREERALDKAWGDFYIGEEDSDDDAYDRMVMGRSGAKIVPEVVKNMAGKKNSKKALRWLGLA